MWAVTVANPDLASFAVGLFAGWVISSFYRIVKRNGKGTA